MKKIFLFLIFLFNFINLYSQNDSLLTDGYYMGEYKDSIVDYYIFLKYINGDDDVIIVIPYNYDNNMNKMTNIINKKIIYLSNIEDYETYLMLEDKWTIKGFDNFPYFTLYDGLLQFSLNIADVDSGIIEIFDFSGKISNDRMKIDAIIKSNRGTFEKQEIIFNYIK